MFENYGRHRQMHDVLEDLLAILIRLEVGDTLQTELRILASVMLAKVSRPSKTRSAFAAVRSFSVTVKVFLNAQSDSPIPLLHRGDPSVVS